MPFYVRGGILREEQSPLGTLKISCCLYFFLLPLHRQNKETDLSRKVGVISLRMKKLKNL